MYLLSNRSIIDSMNYREFGKSGWKVSEIALGTWQVGGGWRKKFDHSVAETIINCAIDEGVNFIDTADVYYSGLSESTVAKVVQQRPERVYVATKCGRRIFPHENSRYTPERLEQFVDKSLQNMGVECLDLIQLHCPPPEVYQRDEIFALFEKLKQQGKINYLGVSVETVEQAQQAMRYPHVVSIQFIFNMFRQKPIRELLPEAQRRQVALIARVPLASGLLSGTYDDSTIFSTEDHRTYNREGAAFDKGETFSGVPYTTGLKAVEELKSLFGQRAPLAMIALRWILMFSEISTVIPGASKPEQVSENNRASELTALTPDEIQGVEDIYNRHIRQHVHHLW